MASRKASQESTPALIRQLRPRARRAFEVRIRGKAKSGARKFRRRLEQLDALERKNLEALSFHAAELYSSAIDAQRLVERIGRSRKLDDTLELLISLAWEVRNLSEHSDVLKGPLARATGRIAAHLVRLGKREHSLDYLAQARAMGELIRTKLYPDLIAELAVHDSRTKDSRGGQGKRGKGKRKTS